MKNECSYYLGMLLLLLLPLMGWGQDWQDGLNGDGPWMVVYDRSQETGPLSAVAGIHGSIEVLYDGNRVINTKMISLEQSDNQSVVEYMMVGKSTNAQPPGIAYSCTDGGRWPGFDSEGYDGTQTRTYTITVREQSISFNLTDATGDPTSFFLSAIYSNNGETKNQFISRVNNTIASLNTTSDPVSNNGVGGGSCTGDYGSKVTTSSASIVAIFSAGAGGVTPGSPCGGTPSQGTPCSNIANDPVRFRFGQGSWACANPSAPITASNYIILEDGTAYELNFYDGGGSDQGTYCGPDVPEVQNQNSGGNWQPFPGFGPAGDDGPDDPDDCEGENPRITSTTTPPFWDSFNAFNFNNNDFFSINKPESTTDWYVQDRRTNEWNLVSNSNNYFFCAEGRDEWGRVKIRAVYNCPGGGEQSYNRTVELDILDYGVYFLGNNAQLGNLEKFRPGDPSNQYFDPSKPTMIYVHGLSDGSVLNHKRELIRENRVGVSMADRWRNQGWNVGIYYWNQFADVPLSDRGDAEDKIYEVGPNPWRLELEQFTNSSPAAPTVSVGALLGIELNRIRQKSQAGLELRLGAHSLGASLAAEATDFMSNANLPDRVAYLDPYWTSNRQFDLLANVQSLNLQGRSQEMYISSLLKAAEVNIGAISALNDLRTASNEFDYVSAVQNLADAMSSLDTHGAIIDETVAVALDPKWRNFDPLNPIGAITDQHYIAVDYYFRSIESPEPWLVTKANWWQVQEGDVDLVFDDGDGLVLNYNLSFGSAVSASSCTEKLIRYKGSKYFQVLGQFTEDTSDDYFEDYGSYELGQEVDEWSLFSTTFASNGNAPQKYDPLSMWNPTDATTGGTANRLLIKPANRYASSYSCQKNTPLWSSWHLSAAWHDKTRGNGNGYKRDQIVSGIPGDWADNPIAGCTTVIKKDYGCSGFEAGHLAPSGDRNRSIPDGQETFKMTNMVPQNGVHNRGAWLGLESDMQKLARDRAVEIFIAAGGAGQGGTSKQQQTVNTIGPNDDINVPSHLWKVVLVVPRGVDNPNEITFGSAAQAFGVWIPNDGTNGKNRQRSWKKQEHLKTVAEIEDLLFQTEGVEYRFFDDFDPGVGDWLKEMPFDPEQNLPFIVTTNLDYGAQQNGEDVACNAVVLRPGFSAAPGSNYRAYLNPSLCSGNAAIALASEDVDIDKRLQDVNIQARIKKEDQQKTPVFTQVFPNPFENSFTLRYDLQSSQHVTVELIDLFGRVVRQNIVNKEQYAGRYRVKISGEGIIAGTYMLRIDLGDQGVHTQRIVKI